MERAFDGSTIAILPTICDIDYVRSTSSTSLRIDERVEELLSRFFLRPRV